MSRAIKLLNLPWTFTKSELSKFLSRTLNTRIRFSRILYDKQTGLSRGIGIAQIENEEMYKDVLRRGTLSVEGRNVLVVKNIEAKKQVDASL